MIGVAALGVGGGGVIHALPKGFGGGDVKAGLMAEHGDQAGTNRGGDCTEKAGEVYGFRKRAGADFLIPAQGVTERGVAGGFVQLGWQAGVEAREEARGKIFRIPDERAVGERSFEAGSRAAAPGVGAAEDENGIGLLGKVHGFDGGGVGGEPGVYA